jgi:hypothetical protein
MTLLLPLPAGPSRKMAMGRPCGCCTAAVMASYALRWEGVSETARSAQMVHCSSGSYDAHSLMGRYRCAAGACGCGMLGAMTLRHAGGIYMGGLAGGSGGEQPVVVGGSRWWQVVAGGGSSRWHMAAGGIWQQVAARGSSRWQQVAAGGS